MFDFQLVRDSLKTPQWQRSHLQESMLKSLTEEIELFKRLKRAKFSGEIHTNCCQLMQYQEFSPQEEIIAFGRPNAKLIWILSGKISVFTSEKIHNQLKLNLANIKFSERHRPGIIIGDSLKKPPSTVKERGDFSIKKVTQHEYAQMQSLFMKEIDDEFSMMEGPNQQANVEVNEIRKYYGETAMFSTSKSAFCVRAIDRVEALVLRQQDFIKAIEKHATKEVNDRVATLKNFPQFSSWGKFNLYRISELFSVKHYQRGQLVFKENDPVEFVYFITQGEFKISETIVQETHLIKQSKGKKLLRTGSPRKVDKKHSKEICRKGPYQLIGREECLEKQRSRTQNCECLSLEGTLYLLSKDLYLEEVMSRPELHSIVPPPAKRPDPVVEEKKDFSQSIRLRFNISVSPKHIKEKTRKASLYSPKKPLDTIPITEYNKKYFKRKPIKRHEQRKGAPPNFMMSTRNRDEFLYEKLMMFSDLIKSNQNIS